MHLHIISRADAKRAGLKYYFTGKPCKHGHYQRSTATGACRDCKIAFHARNAEKINEKKREYIAKNKEKKRAADKAYYEANKEKISQYGERYRKENRERILAQKRKYHFSKREFHVQRSREYYKANFDVLSQRKREYNAKNKDLVRQWSRNSKARRKGADGFHTKDDIQRILESQKNKCANCMCDVSGGYHVDHIMPIILGGTNWPENLQILCPTCNLRKNAKDPLDWAQENGRLL